MEYIPATIPLGDFQRWSAERPGGAFDKAAVQRFRASLEKRGLAPSSINVRLSAIRKLAAEAADNGLLAPELAARDRTRERCQALRVLACSGGVVSTVMSSEREWQSLLADVALRTRPRKAEKSPIP